MKKFLFIFAAATLSSLTVFANNSLTQEALFSETVKELDMGGIALQYQKFDNLENIMTSLVDLAAASATNAEFDPMVKMQLQLLTNSFHNLIKQANFNSIKSYGMSVKKQNDSTYISKHFSYTGANPTGILYDLIGRNNQPFKYLNIVPENAIFACSMHIDMGIIYQSIYDNVIKNNPMAMQYLPVVEMQLGMPLMDFMKSLSGEYVSFATTSITDNAVTLQGLIRIPDKSGNLAKLIKAALMTQENIINLPVNKFNGMIAPILVCSEGSVIISSNLTALTQSINAQDSKRNILTNANLKKYANYLNNNGIAQIYIALDDAQVQLINSLFTSLNIAAKIDPIYSASESFVTENGYKSVMASSFNTASPENFLAIQAALLSKVAELDNLNPLVIDNENEE